MWEPFRLSIEQWAPQCSIVYDKFHILQHANDAVDEVRRAEFFRKGPKMRDLIKGKKWLLLSRWKNLEAKQRGVLNRLFQLNRRVFKAYMLKESLERLWDYRYEGAMLNYLKKWIAQLRWQRLPSFEKLAAMLLKHLDGILNYCRTTINTSTGGNLGERNLSSASSVGLVERSKNGTTSCVFQVRLMIRAESR
jgi:transposase